MIFSFVLKMPSYSSNYNGYKLSDDIKRISEYTQTNSTQYSLANAGRIISSINQTLSSPLWSIERMTIQQFIQSWLVTRGFPVENVENVLYRNDIYLSSFNDSFRDLSFTSDIYDSQVRLNFNKTG